MPIVLVMEMAIYQVIDMVTVWKVDVVTVLDSGVSTLCAVNVRVVFVGMAHTALLKKWVVVEI